MTWYEDFREQAKDTIHPWFKLEQQKRNLVAFMFNNW
jgi:hypothetical protein